MPLRKGIHSQFINTSVVSPLIYGPLAYLLQWRTASPLSSGGFRKGILLSPIKVTQCFQNQLHFTAIRDMKVSRSIPTSPRGWQNLILLGQTLDGCLLPGLSGPERAQHNLLVYFLLW